MPADKIRILLTTIRKRTIMKIKYFFLLLISGIGFFTYMTYAQENNYIVSKYDFIPGEKVIFYDDFTAESAGDFPSQWLTNGSGEIVTSKKFPGRWFQITKAGYYIPDFQRVRIFDLSIRIID